MSQLKNKSILNIGLVGPGNIATNRHLPALAARADVLVKAVAGRTLSKARTVAEAFNIPQYYSDWREIADANDLDIICICTPPNLHAEIASRALLSGKHVFLEKPIGLSNQECDKLLEIAERSSGLLMVGFNMRFHRHVRKAQRTISEGMLGEIIAVNAVHTTKPKSEPEWLQNRETGGGVLIELAVHYYDLWCYLFQSSIHSVTATTNHKKKDESSGSVTTQMENGIIASVVFSKESVDNHQIDIYGTKGQLKLSRYMFDGYEHLLVNDFPGSPSVRLKKLGNSLRYLPHAVAAFKNGGDLVSSFKAEWDHFLNAVRGNTVLAFSLREYSQVMNAVLAGLRSAETDKTVKLDDLGKSIE